MFINYLTLLLTNLTAGLILLALFLIWGLGKGRDRDWALPFGTIGGLGFILSLHMVTTWPLTGPFNMAFGESSLLFSTLFLATAVGLAAGWSLKGVAYYGMFVGIASIVIGIRVLDLGLTKSPNLSGAGFILTGAAGALAGPAMIFFGERRAWRVPAALLLLVCAGIWGVTGLGAYWGHMESTAKWKPAPMAAAVATPSPTPAPQ